MSEILRYDKSAFVHTNLNPLEDLSFWIKGLGSIGYVSDILKIAHNIKNRNDIKCRAKTISRHADLAVQFISQGFNGPIETSFLPLYYCLLNLSKIYILCSSKNIELEKNRWHGAICKFDKNNKFLKDKIIITKRGTIPLFYEVLTHEKLINKSIIEIKDIYPYIHNISHEYKFIYKKTSKLQSCKFSIIGNQQSNYKINCNLLGDIIPGALNKIYNQILKDFKKINDTKYQSKFTFSNKKEAEKQLNNSLKRFLLYTEKSQHDTSTKVPISSKSILLPEELPILLAFFHLSNIVRYNPDYLYQIKDSKDWSMIQPLSRHGVCRFMILFWSYFHQKTFYIN